MDVRLLYFGGCPHWVVADQRLRPALASLGRRDETIQHVLVETSEDAERLGFMGPPPSCSTDATRSQQAVNTQLSHVASSLRPTGEPGLRRWLSWWRGCHEACPGTGHRCLSGGGGRRVGAGAYGSHRLWLRRRLLVSSAWAAPVPLGLSSRSQELVGWWTEADDRILNHDRLPRDCQVSTRSHRPDSGAGQRAGVAGSRVAGGHRAATRSALDAARRRADSGVSGRWLGGHTRCELLLR